MVKLSVFRADEHSPLQVARQHRQTERALEQSGLAYTILRPVFFMQNLFGMLRHGAIRTATGHGRVAMIDARDIASAAVTTLTSDAARRQDLHPDRTGGPQLRRGREHPRRADRQPDPAHGRLT